jgi:hypothetical protein
MFPEHLSFIFLESVRCLESCSSWSLEVSQFLFVLCRQSDDRRLLWVSRLCLCFDNVFYSHSESSSSCKVNLQFLFVLCRQNDDRRILWSSLFSSMFPEHLSFIFLESVRCLESCSSWSLEVSQFLFVLCRQNDDRRILWCPLFSSMFPEHLSFIFLESVRCLESCSSWSLEVSQFLFVLCRRSDDRRLLWASRLRLCFDNVFYSRLESSSSCKVNLQFLFVLCRQNDDRLILWCSSLSLTFR